MNKVFAVIRNPRNALATGALTLMSVPAFADVAAATAEIATAKTDGLAIAGGLLGLAVAVWGALYIKRKFFG